MRRQFPNRPLNWFPDLMESLSEGARQQLLDASHVVTVARGETLELPEQALVRVEKGLLKIGLAYQDRRLVIALLPPGVYFVQGLCLASVAPWNLHAAEDTEARLYPSDAVRAVAAAEPEFSWAVLTHLCTINRIYSDQLQSLAFLTVRGRVARAFILLTALMGRKDGTGADPGLRVSQEELGELVGASRESVSLTLQEMTRDGLVDVGYARVIIRDMARLREEIGPDPSLLWSAETLGEKP